MFMSLDEKDLAVVIDAMAERKVGAGEVVIQEGDAGAELYIVESGHLTVTKMIDGKSKTVFAYDADGDKESSHVFGELALLYNAPRAATVTADKDSSLYALDRQTFNHIVQDASQRKRAKYEEFLGTVPILKNMDHYERSKLADAIKETAFNAGDKLIVQGDTENCNCFYILVEGEAFATLNDNPDKPVM